MIWPLRALRRRAIGLLGRLGPIGRVMVLGDQMGWSRLARMIELVEGTYGHARSVRAGGPMDTAGNPLPWFTYPAVEFLEGLDLSDLSVFEFGSGYGSLYFADRTASVTSVESDEKWAEVVRRNLRSNQVLLHRPEGPTYVAAVHDGGRRYDVIVVDGLHRQDCAREALGRLADDGMLILDNSDWHPETARLLREAGLIQVDFSGLGPGNLYTWTTSFFLTRGVNLKPREGRQPHYSRGAVRQVSETDQPAFPG